MIWSWWADRLFIDVIGLTAGVYRSLKALSTAERTLDVGVCKRWLVYWTLLVLSMLLTRLFESAMWAPAKRPFPYMFLKCVFVAWLQCEDGAAYLWHAVLKQPALQYEEPAARLLERVQTRTRALLLQSAWQLLVWKQRIEAAIAGKEKSA